MAVEAGSSAYWQAKRGTVQRGLVGHWDSMAMSSRTGNIVYDLAGNNNGTLTNGATFERIGMGFDGANDYVNLGTTLNSRLIHSLAFSISAWIFSVNISGNRSIINNARYTPNYDGINFLISAGKLRFDLSGNTGSFPLKRKETVNAVILTNQWYHICVTKPANIATSGIKLFINGIEPSTVDAFNDTITDVVNSINLQVGARDGGNEVFFGNIDDIRIYSRALSQSEITQNFNATRYRFGV